MEERGIGTASGEATRLLSEGRPGHDHGACVDTALSHARDVTALAGRPLTGLRLEVLNELLRQHRPRGAYELRDALADGTRKVQPIQIYRALDSLARLRLVHRVESRNAYIACTGGPDCDAPQLLICEGCDRVDELGDEALGGIVDLVAERTGFTITRSLVEITGLCPDCARNAKA
ncbi:MAG: transcriptional repressor [Pseudomonadota bacterium]